MLLANPSIEELYHKSCALAEDTQEVKDSFQHPARLIKVHYTHFTYISVPCAWADNDVMVLFHCWVLTMWKSLNWSWLVSSLLVVDPQRYDYLNMCLTLLSFFLSLSLFLSFFFFALPVSHTHYPQCHSIFHLTFFFSVALLCTRLSFISFFSFWWEWEVKMRPWPLVVTGLPLWMELTQRGILQSL